MATAVNLSTQQYFGFNPKELPGIQLWLDAADATTVTGTTTVTAWADKSGKGRNMGVGSGTTSYGAYGPGSAIKLNASYMFVTSAVDMTNATFFIVAASPSLTNNQSAFTARPNTSLSYSSTDGIGFYIDSGGTRIQGSGATLNNSIGISGTVMTSATLASTGAGATWQNGTTYNTASFSARTSTAQGFSIGGEWQGSSYANVTTQAYIYEIIVYNNVLSPSQRQTVEGYLAWKWGIAATLPTIHPYYAFPPAMRIFTPLDVPGCKMWLDGADLSTMSPANATAGTSITAWRDKSANAVSYNSGAVAGQAGSTTASPTYVAGGGLLFNNSFNGAWVNGTTQGLSAGSQFTGNFTNFTVFAVVNYLNNTTVGYNAIMWAAAGIPVGSFFDFDAYGQTRAQLYVDSGTVNLAINNSWLPQNVKTIDMFDVKPTGAAYWYNGVQNISNAFSYTQTSFPTIMSVQIANQAPGGRSFPGTIYELIWYEGQSLTVPQRQQIEGYLQWKWRTTALPTTHPYYSLPPVVAANFESVQPLVKLRAVKYSGSGTWFDESTNGRNATIENGTAAKNAAGNGIVLNGSTNWQFSDVNAGNAWTLSCWWKTTGYNGTNPSIVTQIYPGTNNRINIQLGLAFPTLGGSFYDGSVWRNGTNLAALPSKWTNHHITWDGTTLSTYTNGVLFGATTPGGTAASSTANYRIGRRWDNPDYIIGTIGEVRIYGYPFNAGQVLTDYAGVAASTLYNY